MRPGLPGATWPGLAMLATLAASHPASAQVTVNPGALDLLPAQPAPRTNQRPARPAPATQPRQPQPQRPAARTPAPPTPATATPATPPAPAQPPAAQARPTLPTIPPAIAALPPALPVPPARPQPTPVAPVAADAPGTASPVPGGIRITFGTERQDLNPVTESALRTLARTLLGNEQSSVNLYAYAAGIPEDPSTARRLSLARALAARAVLINEGVASTRIYPRALGATGGETDRDRVDVVTGNPGPPSAQPASVQR